MSKGPNSTHAEPTQKLVKITRHALPVIDGGDLGIRESGDVSVEWIDR